MWSIIRYGWVDLVYIGIRAKGIDKIIIKFLLRASGYVYVGTPGVNVDTKGKLSSHLWNLIQTRRHSFIITLLFSPFSSQLYWTSIEKIRCKHFVNFKCINLFSFDLKTTQSWVSTNVSLWMRKQQKKAYVTINYKGQYLWWLDLWIYLWNPLFFFYHFHRRRYGENGVVSSEAP